MTAPFCTGCGQQMKHFGPGTNKAGKNYNASWRCPGQCKGTAVWIKDGEDQPQAAPQGAVNGSGSNGGGRHDDPSGRSIEAQTAIRGACDVAAAIGPLLLAQQDAAPAVVTEFAVTLARRLLREVVYQVTGAPLPAGLAMPRTGYGARRLAPANTGPAFPPADSDVDEDGVPYFGDNR